ncbi:hypothetical protein NE848_04220 [Gramella jeungdoensis]|uniref:Uncharacterized protein n=1 Tax=Gramella jeungdoensis TaxID=708091 RepID=A0ABT0YZK1_9FLAO|nr:hypothetical protein [Gramella jeungdoensis]MCM8568570.1 hypothetical protein [Gramella jeungdoensis]
MMEIKPLQGIGMIKFGMTEKELKEVLGDPTNRKSTLFPANNSESIDLEYAHLGLQFHLTTENNLRLESIRFNNPDHSLFGEYPIGQEASFLNKECIKRNLPDLQLEYEYIQPGKDVYYSEEKGVLIYSEGGVITSIVLFPQYDASGENIIWPG